MIGYKSLRSRILDAAGKGVKPRAMRTLSTSSDGPITSEAKRRSFSVSGRAQAARLAISPRQSTASANFLPRSQLLSTSATAHKFLPACWPFHCQEPRGSLADSHPFAARSGTAVQPVINSNGVQPGVQADGIHLKAHGAQRVCQRLGVGALFDGICAKAIGEM